MKDEYLVRRLSELKETYKESPRERELIDEISGLMSHSISSSSPRILARTALISHISKYVIERDRQGFFDNAGLMGELIFITGSFLGNGTLEEIKQ